MAALITGQVDAAVAAQRPSLDPVLVDVPDLRPHPRRPMGTTRRQGWGGYWAWDPVENAGLLPWFTVTAFLHSIMIQSAAA